MGFYAMSETMQVLDQQYECSNFQWQKILFLQQYLVRIQTIQIDHLIFQSLVCPNKEAFVVLLIGTAPNSFDNFIFSSGLNDDLNRCTA